MPPPNHPSGTRDDNGQEIDHTRHGEPGPPPERRDPVEGNTGAYDDQGLEGPR